MILKYIDSKLLLMIPYLRVWLRHNVSILKIGKISFALLWGFQYIEKYNDSLMYNIYFPSFLREWDFVNKLL